MTFDIEPAVALRVKREVSLPALVRAEIERLIETGELAPGDWVNEAMIAARLGVSRGPVREACRGLEQSGLLIVIVNRGAFVREISTEEAAELYDLRAVLFALAGRKLAARITDDDIRSLSYLVERMEVAAEADSLNDYYPLNLEFHRALLAMAKSPRLLQTYQSLVRELHLFRRRALVSEGRMRESNAEHRAIVAALAKRDADRAASLMQSHVLDAKRRVLPQHCA